MTKILGRIKRVRQHDYFSLVKPLKEKYAEQNLNDLAKHGKCDIKVWFQAKRSEEPKLIASSGTTYTDELNFVTKNRPCAPRAGGVGKGVALHRASSGSGGETQ